MVYMPARLTKAAPDFFDGAAGFRQLAMIFRKL